MNIRKALLVKPVRELLTVTAYISHTNKREPQTSKRKRRERVYIYRTLKILVKNYGAYSDLTKQDTFCINYFVNRKMQ